MIICFLSSSETSFESYYPAGNWLNPGVLSCAQFCVDIRAIIELNSKRMEKLHNSAVIYLAIHHFKMEVGDFFYACKI